MRFVTLEIENFLLSVFISVGIQWINCREICELFFGTNETVHYIHVWRSVLSGCL